MRFNLLSATLFALAATLGTAGGLAIGVAAWNALEQGAPKKQQMDLSKKGDCGKSCCGPCCKCGESCSCKAAK